MVSAMHVALHSGQFLEGNIGSPNLGFSYSNFLGENTLYLRQKEKLAKKHILEKGKIKITIFDEKVRSIFQAAEN